jgi:hypothetical protein
MPDFVKQKNHLKMKKIIYLPLIACFFLLTNCSEIPPEINPIDPNTGGEGQQRSVLVEEYTGVRCVNCPAGSEALKALIDIYGDRLAVVSFHAGFFAPPYPESLYDFRTDDGNNLLSFLGEPLGYPAAVVNRRLFDGERRLQVGQGLWAGYIAEEIVVPPKMEIDLAVSYDSLSRELDITVDLTVVESLAGEEVQLSIALTEDDIADVQLTPQGKQADYVHKHVLRDMITNFDGNLLTEELSAGAEISRSFSYTINADWDATKCKVIAFVSLGGEVKDVLQVQQAEVE